MKRIVLPTDFSDNSWSAVVYAMKLFSEESCTFYFLHSTLIKALIFSNLSSKLLETIRDDAMKELLELKIQAEKSNTNTNHVFEVVLSTDGLVEAIEDTVKSHKIDIVVVGTKGATGAKEFFFGSNTVKLIERMKSCPVLVVPDDYNFIVPKQLAYPTDFNRYFSEKELRPLKDLVTLYASKIRILHINVEEKLNAFQKFNMFKLDEYLKQYEHSFHWMPYYTKKEKEINSFIQELEIDMLAMVNYKHSLIEYIVKEPVIKKLGFHLTIPFLVIPE